MAVYIGGVRPFLPTLIRGAKNVPSGCLVAATANIFTPGLRSLLSPGTKVTICVAPSHCFQAR